MSHPKFNGDTKSDAKSERRLALWRKRERAFIRLINANTAFNAAGEALAAHDRENP